jgi:hypothetical protein
MRGQPFSTGGKSLFAESMITQASASYREPWQGQSHVFLQRVPVHYAAEMSTDSGEFVNISRFVFVSGNFFEAPTNNCALAWNDFVRCVHFTTGDNLPILLCDVKDGTRVS